jgi:pyridinium-3,5-biscarboxylic acid mononucleotide synthase
MRCVCLDEKDLEDLLRGYKQGSVTLQDALGMLKKLPYEDMGFAMVDHHRQLRQGFPEVIYAAGKTKEQIRDIMLSLYHDGQENIIATRAEPDVYAYMKEALPDVQYNTPARMLYVERNKTVPDASREVLVLAAGTSDLPVAEEARLTAHLMGNAVRSCYDVGVAGIHRLFAHMQDIERANVIIVTAGMEGALASVVGGLTPKPVIAVPTSVGYGASFHGLSALLAMLNSCASGVAVMNIDNGFGAGALASKINHMR